MHYTTQCTVPHAQYTTLRYTIHYTMLHNTLHYATQLPPLIETIHFLHVSRPPQKLHSPGRPNSTVSGSNTEVFVFSNI